jgi:ankyrin repeat protein
MMEVKNVDGLTPLLWCAAHGRTEAAKWCVANGADILATDSKGRLPRQIADARGHAETAAVLSALAREKWLKV